MSFSQEGEITIITWEGPKEGHKVLKFPREPRGASYEMININHNLYIYILNKDPDSKNQIWAISDEEMANKMALSPL